MSFLSFLLGEKKKSASVAKERLHARVVIETRALDEGRRRERQMRHARGADEHA